MKQIHTATKKGIWMLVLKPKGHFMLKNTSFRAGEGLDRCGFYSIES
jgi:hypothetical protein